MIDARGATAVAIADAVRDRQAAGARSGRAVPRSDRARWTARSAATCWSTPTGRGGGPTPSTPRCKAGRDPGPLAGVPLGIKDIFCTRGRRDHLCVEDPARLRAALRVDGHGAAGGGGRRRARQAEHGRVRDGLVEREQLASSRCATRGRPRTCPGGSSGGSAAAVAASLCAGATRDRHRRLDPAAGRAVRRRRHEADLRAGLALRRDRLRLVARSPGTVRAHRRGRGGAAGGDGRARSARRDQHPAAGRRLPRRPRAPGGGAAGVRLGVPDEYFQRGHGPRGRGRGARGARRARRARARSSSRCRCPTPSTRSPPTT